MRTMLMALLLTTLPSMALAQPKCIERNGGTTCTMTISGIEHSFRTNVNGIVELSAKADATTKIELVAGQLPAFQEIIARIGPAKADVLFSRLMIRARKDGSHEEPNSGFLWRATVTDQTATLTGRKIN